MHRFLSPETAACFDGVTTTQVRNDLAEMDGPPGWFSCRPGWVERLIALRFDDEALTFPALVNYGLRFIVDNERAEIARLRGLIELAATIPYPGGHDDDCQACGHLALGHEPDCPWLLIQQAADELDPKD